MGPGDRARSRVAGHRAGQLHRAAGSLGLRQDHLPAHRRRTGDGERGAGGNRRARRDASAAGRARRRHGVPILRAVPASVGGREHSVRPEGATRGAGGAGAAAGPRGGDAGHRRVAGPQAVAGVRRPAAARGAGPRHRRRGPGLPDGRAAVEPGRPVARRDAARDRRPAAPARPHHGLRHARSDRGDEHGRPGDRAAQRPARAGRAAGRGLRSPRQPVRRRLHRRAADEPVAARGARRRHGRCRHRRARAGARRRHGAGRRPAPGDFGPRPSWRLRPGADAACRAQRIPRRRHGADRALATTAHRLQARLPGRHTAAAGALLRLGFPRDALHLFDAATGARLGHVPGHAPVPALA